MGEDRRQQSEAEIADADAPVITPRESIDAMTPPEGADQSADALLSNYMTIQEAATLLGVTDATLRQAILQDRLVAVVLFGRKLVSRAAVEEYRLRTRPDGEKPRGRPRKSS